MSADQYVLGNTCEVTAKSSRGEIGDVAVVGAVSRKEPNNTATVYVFAEAADAQAVSKHVLAVDKGLTSSDSSDVLSGDDFASLLSKARRKVDAKKGSFNASFSSAWRSLFAPPGTTGVGDALVGKVVTVSELVLYDVDGKALAEPLYSGKATVAKAHEAIPGLHVRAWHE